MSNLILFSCTNCTFLPDFYATFKLIRNEELFRENEKIKSKNASSELTSPHSLWHGWAEEWVYIFCQIGECVTINVSRLAMA